LSKALTSIQVTGGQPSRGTSLGALKFANGNGTLRTLRICDDGTGTLMVDTKLQVEKPSSERKGDSEVPSTGAVAYVD
jgi:hypothetical protein